MTHVIITGFRPYSPLTHLAGNPSEVAARRLQQRVSQRAHVEIMKVDASCLPIMSALARQSGTSAIVMFGAAVQLVPVVLELEGVSKADGLFAKKTVIASPAAQKLKDFAASIGVPSDSTPLTPFVYWCLRSYGAALAEATPRGIPCIFLHVNTIGVSRETQVGQAVVLVERMLSEARRS